MYAATPSLMLVTDMNVCFGSRCTLPATLNVNTFDSRLFNISQNFRDSMPPRHH